MLLLQTYKLMLNLHMIIYTTLSTSYVANGIGFKITLSMKTNLYLTLFGKDRSYNQLINPYVVFLEKFENLIKTNYMSYIKFKMLL